MNIKSVLATIETLVFGKINLLLLVTNRCNSRCTICNYWQQERHDLPVYIIKQLLNSKIVNKNGVTLEGGEAVLHPDIREILKLLKGLNYTLLTNGLLSDKLNKLVDTYKIPNVSVSLDGTKEVYEKIRGIDGYDSVINTIKFLKTRTNLSICFTISPQNTFEDYLHVKKICDRYKIPLLLNIYVEMEYSGKRFSDKPIDTRYDKLPNKYVSKYNKWVKGDIKSNCFGIRYICNVFPDGKVVLCQSKPNVVFGNLHEKSIDEIWKERPRIKCNDCWMSCNRYLEAKWIIS